VLPEYSSLNIVLPTYDQVHALKSHQVYMTTDNSNNNSINNCNDSNFNNNIANINNASNNSANNNAQ
jgi:hypothetical protein